MPSKERVLGDWQRKYLKHLQYHNRSQGTLKEYGYTLTAGFRSLMEGGMEFSPTRVGTAEIHHMMTEGFTGTAHSIRRNISIVGNFLEFCGNPVVKKMYLPWPRCERRSVDWLDPLTGKKLMNSARGIERVIVQLELNQGMRRVEVVRLELGDLPGMIYVKGKGRGGPKPRKLPYHHTTLVELERWQDEREGRIDQAIRKHGPVIAPPHLLIHNHTPKGLTQYTPKGISNIMVSLSKRTGIRFTNHTLRRTFGRKCWQAGMKLETIKELLGHDTIEQTIQYLGIRDDDKVEAMQMLKEFEDAL